MPGFRESLRREIAELEEQLQANPVFLKLQHLNEVARLYDGTTPQPASIAAAPRAEAPLGGRGAGKIKRAIDPERVRTLQLAMQVIKGRPRPTKTAEIYEMIAPLGAKIGGGEPKSNLSAMLHHAPEFVSHGRLGWTLAAVDVAESTSEGSAEDRASNPIEPSGNVTKQEGDDLDGILG
jgi:hypothetical protein